MKYTELDFQPLAQHKIKCVINNQISEQLIF